MKNEKVKWYLITSDPNNVELSIYWRIATTEEMMEDMVNLVSEVVESERPYTNPNEDIPYTETIDEIQKSSDGSTLYAYAKFPYYTYELKAIKADSVEECFWC